MPIKESRFRLRSSAFIRSEENKQIEPKKAIFLSVEGDETERNYFEHLQRYLENSGNNSIIRIEVLRHKRGDGYSSPEQVIELLNEYVNLRNGELIPEELPHSFTSQYPQDLIKCFLEGTDNLTKSDRNKISEELLKIGIDLKYRQYLKTFNKKSDFFGVILDRDCGNHSRQLMIDCINTCKEEGYGCYITNPCFEFWLLLHLCDVQLEYKDKLDEILINEKISKGHTYVSHEVSQRAHHNKRISLRIFKTMYLPQISQAIKNSKTFAVNLEEILDNLGSNLPELFHIIGHMEEYI